MKRRTTPQRQMDAYKEELEEERRLIYGSDQARGRIAFTLSG